MVGTQTGGVSSPSLLRCLTVVCEAISTKKRARREEEEEERGREGRKKDSTHIDECEVCQRSVYNAGSDKVEFFCFLIFLMI